MEAKIRCVCPDKDGQTRHPDGDTIKFRDRLDPHGARAARYDIKALYADGDRASTGEIMAVLIEDALIFGIESWTLVDEKGKPVEVSKRTIVDLVLSSPEADKLGDEAVPLYQGQMVDPLAAQVSDFLRPTPTKRSTSAPKPSASTTAKSSGRSSTPPTPLKRSSTSTTPTDGIEATSTSLDGVSSSSQSESTAA